MDIEHRRPGNMVITLTDDEKRKLAFGDFVMDRNGLCGSDTKTWVRTDMPTTEAPAVQIDGDSDVMVYLPLGTTFPVTIEQVDMDPFVDPDRSRITHHFGDEGVIVVQ